MDLSFKPSFDPSEVQGRLDRLLVPGALTDPGIDDRITRLASRFRSYAASYPLPLWSPGLVITNEMRGFTEALFPIAEARAVFELVLRHGCRFPPMLPTSYLHSTSNWLDLLDKLQPQVSNADPAATLRELALDGSKRREFLFALMLPRHFGGGFDRYPLQSQWLSGWLGENHDRLKGRIRGLDSACGSGEGTYALAEIADAAGHERAEIHGSTIEEIELFAAAHAYFPHDPERERDYRAKVAPLLEKPALQMEFFLEDVGSKPDRGEYDVVLCNGLLGGPLLHEPAELSGAVRELACRVAPGGVLLAADRFHAGWRQRVPVAALVAMMQEYGLTPLEVPEGIAGERKC
jgi:hypothetical protein